MADTISAARRSQNMRQIRSKDMAPELRVRKLIYALGYRYRLHRKSLPGHPDIIFPKRKMVIFVHGCFWHQHQSPACKITHTPQSRAEYWGPKLDRNRQRDNETLKALTAQGWSVLVVWECQTLDLVATTKAIRQFLAEREKAAPDPRPR